MRSVLGWLLGSFLARVFWYGVMRPELERRALLSLARAQMRVVARGIDSAAGDPARWN